MKCPIVYISFGFLFAYVTFGQVPLKCTKVSSCVCQDKYGNIVDLRPLARKDGLPRYQDVKPVTEQSSLFSFNPCIGFDEGTNLTTCRGVAACMKSNGSFIDIGRHETVRFGHADNWNLSLVYTSSDNKYHTTVILYCDPGVESDMYVLGDLGNNHIIMHLNSKYCCLKSEESISTDTVLRYEHGKTSHPVNINQTHSKENKSDGKSCGICVESYHIVLFSLLAFALLTLAVMIAVYLYQVHKHKKLPVEIAYYPVEVSSDEVVFDRMNKSGK